MAVKIISGKPQFIWPKKVAHHLANVWGRLITKQFSDGEMSPNSWIRSRNHDVHSVSPLFPPADNFFRALLMIDAAKRASTENVNVIIPYFACRQDRKDKPRVAIAPNWLPIYFRRPVPIGLWPDLHADQIQVFDIPLSLDGEYIFVPYLKSLQLREHHVCQPRCWRH